MITDPDGATAAILAHGALNSLSAVSAAIELLSQSAAAEEPLAEHVVDLARSQMDTIVDSLRLIAIGLPTAARDELDALDADRRHRHAAEPDGVDAAAIGDEPIGRRGQARADTRRAVQETALRLAEAHGFENTNVSDIAAGSFISTRTFFRHFASKQDAIWSWVEDESRRLAAHVRAAPSSDGDRQALRTGVRAYVAELAEREGTAARYISLIAESESFSRFGFEQTAVVALADALAGRGGTTAASLEQRVLARTAAAAIAAAMDDFYSTKQARPLADLIVDSTDVVLAPLA